MAVIFRNTRTGRVVEVAEATDVEAATEAEAQRLAGLGTKKSQRAAAAVDAAGQKQMIHARHTIERMDESEKWQRHTPTAPEPDKSGPAPADVRAWAKDAGYEVPARGKLSQDVLDAYQSASEE